MDTRPEIPCLIGPLGSTSVCTLGDASWPGDPIDGAYSVYTDNIEGIDVLDQSGTIFDVTDHGGEP